MGGGHEACITHPRLGRRSHADPWSCSRGDRQAEAYASSRPVTVSDLELDPPGAGEILVRMEASGVCHSDLSVVNGHRIRRIEAGTS